MDYRLLGKNIRQERINTGLTQEKLAEKADISVSFLGQIERGERKLSLETLLSLSKVLCVSVDSLLQINRKIKSRPDIERFNNLLLGRTETEINLLIDVAKTILKYLK